MKWSQELEDQVLAALADRLPEKQLGACAICTQVSWQLLDSFATITASTEMSGKAIAGDEPVEERTPSRFSADLVLPLVSLVCTNCGNTHFLNLLFLDLDHLVAPEESETETATTTNQSGK